jgi:hypothetical protein
LSQRHRACYGPLARRPQTLIERVLPPLIRDNCFCRSARIIDAAQPQIALRQWVLTFPFSWRPRLAPDGALLGQLTRIFVDMVQAFYTRPAEQEGALGAKWADLLMRTFAVEVLECPRCQGGMRLLAMITEPASIARYLAATGEAAEVPHRSPGRGPPYWKSQVLRRRVLGDEDGGGGQGSAGAEGA